MPAKKLIMTIIIAVSVMTLAIAQTTSENPYTILNKYFQAMGGLDRLEAEQTFYFEGDFSMGGLTGTIKYWGQRPDMSRTDLDLGILKITQADHGDYTWVIDSNGKLQKTTNFDDATLKRRQVQKYIENYEYADPTSKFFGVTYRGKEDVDSVTCYKLQITNSINSDTLLYFIDTKDYLLDKSISLDGEESNDTYFKDYRNIDGLMVAFWTRQVPHRTGQAQELTMTTYVSNPEIDPSTFEPPGETAKDYLFAEGDSAVNIPIEYIENHIFVPVTIDCRQTLWVLDTGAGMSVIDRDFAQDAGLELQGDMQGVGAGGNVKVEFTTIPSYSLKGVTFDQQTVAAIDMSELNRLLGRPITGILGYDFLSRFVTKIDYAHELMSIYEPQTFKYTGEGHQLDLHLKDNLFVVTATLDNQHTGSWLFDMGASITSLNGSYAMANGYDKYKSISGLGRGAGNYFESKKIKCDNLEFAGFTVANPIVTFEPGNSQSGPGSDEIGTLGNSLFSNFVIYCDYMDERLIIEKGADFNQPRPYNRAGLQLIRGENGGIEILYVAEKTPAAKAGFQKGDIIKKINDIDIGRFDGIIAVNKLLQAKAGTKYTFEISRSSEIKKLKLKLAELL